MGPAEAGPNVAWSQAVARWAAQDIKTCRTLGVMEGKQLDLDREKQAVSLSRQQRDETIARMRREIVARDCTIEELRSSLTAETYRSRKAEGELSKALAAAHAAEKESEDLRNNLSGMQEGSRAVHTDLDRLENENIDLAAQLSKIRAVAAERAQAMSTLEEEHRNLAAKHLHGETQACQHRDAAEAEEGMQVMKDALSNSEQECIALRDKQATTKTLLQQMEADNEALQRDLKACQSQLQQMAGLEAHLAEESAKVGKAEADKQQERIKSKEAVEALGAQLSHLLDQLAEQEEEEAGQRRRAEVAEAAVNSLSRKIAGLEQEAAHCSEEVKELERKLADSQSEQLEEERMHAERALEMATCLSEAQAKGNQARVELTEAREGSASAKAQVLVMKQVLKQERDLLRQNDAERHDILEQV